MRAILIVRLGSLGDLVHAIPVASALRRAFPDARIDWLVDARNRDLLELVPVIDRRIVIGSLARREPTMMSLWPGLMAAIRLMRRSRYDVAFDLQGLLKSAILGRSSGARRVIGFSTGQLRERGARLFYTETRDAGRATHVIHKNLGLLAAVGVDGSRLDFPIEVPASILPVVTAVRDRLRLPDAGRFALINPGAAWPNKRWPPQRFGELAAALRVRHAVPSAVLWGPGEEALARDVVAASSGAAAQAPRTTIAELVALARAAALMVSGDTGPLHLAAAVGTPIVGLFGPTNPARNGPWAPADVTVSRFQRCACHHQRRCRLPAPCLLDITTEEAIAALDRRLSQGHHA